MFSPSTAGQMDRSFGNHASVILFRRQPDDTFDTGTPIDRAFFLKGATDATPTGGVRVKQSLRTWKLVPSECGSPDPKADDVIQERVSGARWEIDTVDTDEYRQFHTCTSVEEV